MKQESEGGTSASVDSPRRIMVLQDLTDATGGSHKLTKVYAAGLTIDMDGALRSTFTGNSASVMGGAVSLKNLPFSMQVCHAFSPLVVCNFLFWPT